MKSVLKHLAVVFISFLSIAVTLTCSTKPTNPFDSSKTTATLVLETSSDQASDTSITDTVGKNVRIGVASNLPIYLDSISLKIYSSTGTLEKQTTLINSDTSDTAWYELSNLSLGVHSVIANIYVHQGTIFSDSGKITIIPNYAQLTIIADTGGAITAPSHSPDTINYGVATTLTAAPSHGYHFVNWTVTKGAATLGIANSASTNVTLTGGDATVQANFVINTYALTLVAQTGGTITAPLKSLDTVTYAVPTTVTALPDTGYSFVNWTVISDSATIANPDSLTATVTLTSGDASVQANFLINSYKLTLLAGNGGTITTPSKSPDTVNYGAATTITATPNAGYDFVNWTVKSGTATIAHPDSDSTTVTLKSGNATLQANFAIKTYKLALSAATGGTITVPAASPDTVNYGAATKIKAVANTGYSFVKWTVASGKAAIADTNSDSTTVTLTSSDAAVQAVFAINTYKLTISAATGGTIKVPASSPDTVNYGAATKIKASPSTGYSFVKWTVTSGKAAIADTNSDSTTVTLTSSDAAVQAVFAINTNKLTIIAGTGGAITAPASSPVMVNYGAATTITAAPNASGYSFVNWAVISGTASIANPNAASTTVTLTSGDAALQANFSINTYKLTLVAGTGGTITTPNSSPVNLNYGVATTITASTNANYNFVNWTVTSGAATIANATSPSTSVTLTSSDATVQANFVINTYKLTVGAGTGGTITAPAHSPDTVNHGAATTITAAPAAGYTFVNWTVTSGTATFADSSKLSTTVTLTSGDAAVQANFAINTFKLTVNPNTGGNITAPASSPVTVNYGAATTITATPSTGYKFVSWNVTNGTAAVAGASSASTTVTLTSGDATIQPVFAVLTYQLMVAAVGGTISAPTNSPDTVNYGVQTTITAAANPNYNFVNWTVTSGTATITSPTSLTTTVTLTSSDAAVRANFAIQTYALTISAGTGGTITAPSSSPDTVNYGAATTITATPNAGYSFVNWTVASGAAAIGNANNASTSVTLTSGNASVQANFANITFKLTVNNATGGTISAPASSPVTVNYGAATTITATPSTGYSFVNWNVSNGTATIAGATSASTTVTLTSGDATIYPAFAVITYQLSVAANPSAGGNITAPSSSPATVNYGDLTSIHAVANNGYTFVNWTKTTGTASIVDSTLNSTLVSLTSGNATVQANFNFWTRTDTTGFTLSGLFVPALAVSGSSIFAGTSGAGVFVSTNNGTSWIQVNTGLTGPALYILSLAVSGSSIFAGTEAGVFQSPITPISSINWTVDTIGLYHRYVYSLLVSGTTKIFAGTNGGVFESPISAPSWTMDTNGLGSKTVLSLAVSGTGSTANIFAGTSGSGVFASPLSPISWTADTTGLTNSFSNRVVLSLAVSGSTIFAGTEAGVFSGAANASTSWSMATGPAGYIYSLAVSGTNIFAGSSTPNNSVASTNGFYLSTNNGTTWTQTNSGLTTTYVRALAVNSTHVFAGTSGGGVYISSFH